MDRREFLKMFGGAVSGGVVASATMADVGMWAEFLNWMQRKPVWSFPVPATSALTYEDITAVTMKFIVPRMADEVFRVSPIFMKFRQPGLTTMSGGKNCVFPITYGDPVHAG